MLQQIAIISRSSVASVKKIIPALSESRNTCGIAVLTDLQWASDTNDAVFVSSSNGGKLLKWTIERIICLMLYPTAYTQLSTDALHLNTPNKVSDAVAID